MIFLMLTTSIQDSSKYMYELTKTGPHTWQESEMYRYVISGCSRKRLTTLGKLLNKFPIVWDTDITLI